MRRLRVNLFFFIMTLVVCPFSDLFGQQDKLDLSEEIDLQIWKPFKEAYATNDGPLYVSLHSDEILRITKSGIEEGKDFKNKTLERFADVNRLPSNIDFVFEHRIHENDIAYEVGYFQLITMENGKEKGSYYGRFNVLLRRIDGKWKIAQDWDTENINSHIVGKEDFERLKN